MAEGQAWIDDLELENVQVKWGWSHFDGRADTFNDEGDYNFTVVIPPEDAPRLRDAGWAIKEHEGREEGDPPEYTLKVKISYKYTPPAIYLIKGNRKFRADESDLADIRRDATENIDVIITPSRWINGNRSGISAYVKELYATIKQSRFSERYSDFESV